MDLFIVAFLILGLALMLLEAFVPKIGILAISGTICFAIALFVLRQQGTLFELPIGDWALLSIALIGMIVLGASIYFIWRTANQSLPDPLVGRQAKVLEWSGNKGRVHLDGDTWNAQSDTALTAGDIVDITGFDKLAHLTVLVTKTKG